MKPMRKAHYVPWPPSPTPCDGLWLAAAILMIFVGLLLLLCSIPGWAWAAIAGAALVLAGYLLLKTCRR